MAKRTKTIPANEMANPRYTEALKLLHDNHIRFYNDGTTTGRSIKLVFAATMTIHKDLTALANATKTAPGTPEQINYYGSWNVTHYHFTKEI